MLDTLANQINQTPSRPSNHRGLVLVVDDTRELRQLTTRILNGRGYDVIQAADGQEAVAIVRRRGDELAAIILDFQMPVMDGVTALKIIRQEGFKKRCLISTGMTNLIPVLDENSRLLRKPFSPAELLDLVEQQESPRKVATT